MSIFSLLNLCHIKTEPRSEVPCDNSAWWRHWVWCTHVEEVREKGEETDTEQFWKHGDGKRWIKTTVLKLKSAPDRYIGGYLHQPITAFMEGRQSWGLLPLNDVTYHAWTILEVGGGEFFILCERKDNQLEMMFGEGPTALEFMRNFRAIGHARRMSRCIELPRQKVTSRITPSKLFEWIEGTLARHWEPYDIVMANCQHLASDIQHFIIHPTDAEPKCAPPERQHILDKIRRDAKAFESAPPLFQRDRQFVLSAVRRNGWVLQYMPDEFKSDWRIALTAVAQDGLVLADIAEEFRKDRQVVLVAVEQNGLALQYATKELQQDKEVVLTAVKQNGSALQYASEELRRHSAVALTAGWRDPSALRFALR